MIDSIILYFQFFTRIPIPVAVEEPKEKMRSGVRFFSLFGLMLGFIEAVAYWPLQYLFSPSIAWIFFLFFDVMLTGGFHLDALSDMADGLFSSRDKDRMLEIMKDSRVGSNGVLAVVFCCAAPPTEHCTPSCGCLTAESGRKKWDQSFVLSNAVCGK